jgi:hypothetical protein
LTILSGKTGGVVLEDVSTGSVGLSDVEGAFVTRLVVDRDRERAFAEAAVPREGGQSTS